MTALAIILAATVIILVQLILHRRTIRWIDALAEMVSDYMAQEGK